LDKGKVLGILLSLLSILLVVVPIVAAFAAHGWDPKATLLGSSNPVETQFGDLQNLNVENMIGNVSLEDLSSLSLTDLLSVLQGRPITATAQVNSPLSFPITIKDVSGSLVCNDDGVILGNFRLTNAVEIPAHGSKVLSIAGTIDSSGALADIWNHGGLPSNIGLQNVGLKLEIYGITLEGTFGSL